MERAKVYECIDGERAYQQAQGKPDKRPLDDWIYSLRYYAIAAWMASDAAKKEGREKHILPDIRKLAAVCIAALEQYGCPPREGHEQQEATQLPHQVPEELRYIMWRYHNDHISSGFRHGHPEGSRIQSNRSGEDHRERYKVATAWLAGVSVSVIPPGPMVELTPARRHALMDLLEAANHWSIGATRIAKEIVRAMLDEVQA